MRYTITNSTSQQRKAYIQEMFHCRADCDSCGVCALFKGKAPEDVFHDYIEGKREFDEIMKEWRKF